MNRAMSEEHAASTTCSCLERDNHVQDGMPVASGRKLAASANRALIPINKGVKLIELC